jgi:peptide/nickel transport system permease protein
MLIVMSFVTYMLFFMGPIHPERYACGKNCSLAQQEQTKKALGYDKPAIVQWTDFLKGTVQGRTYPDDEALQKAAPQNVVECPAPCLGYSIVNTATVNSEIRATFPVSMSLALMAFIMWMAGGVLFGVVAALKKGTIIDRGIVGISLVFYAFPTFFVGLFLLKFLAIKWQVVPIPEYVSIADGGVGSWMVGLLLPSLTLALFFMAGYVRMTRAFVLETLTEDYIRTARAKGLTKRKVIGKHTLRATLTPLVTLSGLDLAGLLGGTVLTEKVFNFNGAGKMSVDAIQRHDLALVVGIVLLLAAIVIIANIIVDLLYAVIDPRVRLG